MNVFKPDKGRCIELAEEIFLNFFGMNRSGKKYDKMRHNALCARKEIEDSLCIKGLYQYFDNIEVRGKDVLINNYVFSCNGFEQLNPESIEGAYIYALSAGDFSASKESTSTQLYLDMWGTAFTDAGRLLLKEQFSSTGRVSDSFGPGFYGMDLIAMETINQLLDFGSIGIKLHKNQILTPLKACVGIIFMVNESYVEIGHECIHCKGTHISCSLCEIYKRMPKND